MIVDPVMTCSLAQLFLAPMVNPSGEGYDCPACAPYCTCDLETDPDSWECAGVLCESGDLPGYTWESTMCGCYSTTCPEGEHYESAALGCVSDLCGEGNSFSMACACWLTPSLETCDVGFCVSHPEHCEEYPLPAPPQPNCYPCEHYSTQEGCMSNQPGCDPEGIDCKWYTTPLGGFCGPYNG